MARGILAADGRRWLLSLQIYSKCAEEQTLVDNISKLLHLRCELESSACTATTGTLSNIRQDERKRREWYVRTVPPLTHAHPPITEILLLTRRADSVNYWIYEPNKGAPVFFAVAFAFSGLWQLWQGQ